MSPDSFAALVTRCQQGDTGAFDEIVAAMRVPLYSYLARTTGDRHLAEDLLQDVFMRLLENIDRYQESGRFEAWIFRIAANRVRDWARRKGRVERTGGAVSPEDPEQAGTVDRPVESPPDVRLIEQEELRRLETALAALDSDEQEILVLRHYSGLSFQEISDVLGRPLGTVLARSHRALLKMRDGMNRAGPGGEVQ